MYVGYKEESIRLAPAAHRLRLDRGAWLSQRRRALVLWYVGALMAAWLTSPLLLPTLAHAEVAVSPQTTPPVKIPAQDQSKLSAVLADEAEVSQLFAQTLPHFHIDHTALPAPVRKQVVQRIRKYGITYRADLQGMLERAAPYLPIIRLTLQKYELPEYFAYLTLIESAFQLDAMHPKSGAAGLWQLMRITARTYGLRVTKEIDERFEPIRATTAAVRYLRDLQSMFGSRRPLLMLAAYNYGEYNLSKAIARTRTRDIWRLVRLRQLPHETRAYLVRTIAMWVVLAQAERFGLHMDTPKQPLSYLELTFDDPVGLTKLALQLGIDYKDLRAMNRHLLVQHVPALVPIHVPAHVLRTSTQVEVRLAPQALKDKTCCARLHLLTSSKTAANSTPSTAVVVKPVTSPFQPRPAGKEPVLATVPK